VAGREDWRVTMGVVAHLVAALVVVLVAEGVGAANSSCSQALHTFLSRVKPRFDATDKSLTLELMEISDFSTDCRTPFYSVELWRVIHRPGINRPQDFGSSNYFSKDQHCENPNPDLLSRHGQPRRAWGWQQEWEVREGEKQARAEVRFLHVVEREYMLRLCPCQDTGQCTCEHIEPGQRVCSSLIEIPVDNPGEDQVFAWCRGGAVTPNPKIDSPAVSHCPSQVTSPPHLLTSSSSSPPLFLTTFSSPHPPHHLLVSSLPPTCVERPPHQTATSGVTLHCLSR